MNYQTTLGGSITWHKEDDGTYIKVLTSLSKSGKYSYRVIEQDVSEKDYFKRRLDGTA